MHTKNYILSRLQRYIKYLQLYINLVNKFVFHTIIFDCRHFTHTNLLKKKFKLVAQSICSG